jgi:hypothetical protein
MSTHTSIIRFHLPEHRICYTGLNRTEADRAAAKARGEGFSVIRAAKPVTGSRGRLYHYTIIARPR